MEWILSLSAREVLTSHFACGRFNLEDLNFAGEEVGTIATK